MIQNHPAGPEFRRCHALAPRQATAARDRRAAVPSKLRASSQRRRGGSIAGPTADIQTVEQRPFEGLRNGGARGRPCRCALIPRAGGTSCKRRAPRPGVGGAAAAAQALPRPEKKNAPYATPRAHGGLDIARVLQEGLADGKVLRGRHHHCRPIGSGRRRERGRRRGAAGAHSPSPSASARAARLAQAPAPGPASRLPLCSAASPGEAVPCVTERRAPQGVRGARRALGKRQTQQPRTCYQPRRRNTSKYINRPQAPPRAARAQRRVRGWRSEPLRAPSLRALQAGGGGARERRRGRSSSKEASRASAQCAGSWCGRRARERLHALSVA